MILVKPGFMLKNMKSATNVLIIGGSIIGLAIAPIPKERVLRNRCANALPYFFIA